MIIGVIPIGGKGVRLGLPFSKELLPLAGNSRYKPVVSNTTDKMVEAGAEIIIFIHGEKHKLDVLAEFGSKQFIHITQAEPSFAGVLLTLHRFLKKTSIKPTKFLFGLPDTYYNDNPFIDLAKAKDFSCALFTTDDDVKVDRLVVIDGRAKFDVKSQKKDGNSKYFWGCFSFSIEDLERIIKTTDFSKEKEIGNIINTLPNVNCITFGEYHDLGTWKNLNKYWKSIK